MRKLYTHPVFLTGLLLRFLFVIFLTPFVVEQWYLPFLNESLTHFTLNPWGAWLAQNGDPIAFPYGYTMWLVFVPLLTLFKLCGLPEIYGYGATLIVIDFLFLITLQKIFPAKKSTILISYWFSPIVLFACYIRGSNDLIPVFFLVLSIYFIRNIKMGLSGFAYILAVSAKLSMILAFPFFVIYLLHNRSIRHNLPMFFIGLIISTALFLFPFLFSSSGMDMISKNPEIAKIYSLSFNAIPNSDLALIYIIPLIYFIMLYVVWRIRRLNFDLFYVTLGISFLLVVLLTPAAPGWFIWIVPVLIYYQIMGDRMAVFLTATFSGIFILSQFLIAPRIYFKGIPINWLENIYKVSDLGNGLSSIVYTMMTAIGVVLALRMWRDTVNRNDFFRLSRSPFIIGIAGDSGAGKDTFAEALKELFGAHSVTTISGDDYHLWDRQKPMWQVMTHLNPMANDLNRFTSDLLALSDGKNIYARHYDHSTGKMTKPAHIKTNDIIIASGLHALYLPILRESYDLRVYLDIDENLRRFFKLQRDVLKRGHTKESVFSSFEKRENDSNRFIRPQISHADLILSLQPVSPINLDNIDDIAEPVPLRFKLVARSYQGFNELSLTKMLIGICGLHVDMVFNIDASEIQLTIEGDIDAQDLALSAQAVFPDALTFLDIKPKWQDGIMGVMQLITLSHINQIFMKRTKQ